ncbi:MAG: YlmH/Sll1252 family protein [Lachnospiraceae bacterium]|nr:YlmH/Sll1252 family protein [Lachnospiraceae bacterium]
MASEGEREIQQLKNRFAELADKSSRQGIYTFTAFLGLSGQETFRQMEGELKYAGVKLFGGFENAERRVIRFGNPEEFGYEVDFPIRCIHVCPVLPKFADKLSHRDYLGALMRLGIERDTIGDIKTADKEAYFFCLDKVAEFICGSLDRVKHTNVKCTITDSIADIPDEEPERINIQVASMRLDAIIARVYNKSRGECLELFRSGRVFVDGRLCENNSRIIRAGETVNARGYGRFVLAGEPGQTRKGKLCAEILVYR